MACLPIPRDFLDLVNGPRVAALTTLMPDGQPQTTVVWCDYDGECACVNTTLERQKGRNLAVEPRATLLLVDPHGTSRYLEICGGENCVWGYWHKDAIATFRHHGENTILTYWSGYAEPRNSGGCWLTVPEPSGEYDGKTRVVQCPEAGAEFEADGVGFRPYP